MLARGKKVAKAEGFSAPGPAQPPDWHADSQNPHPFLNCRKGGLQSCCRCHSERSVPMLSFSGNRAFRFPVGTRSRRIPPTLLPLRVPHPSFLRVGISLASEAAPPTGVPDTRRCRAPEVVAPGPGTFLSPVWLCVLCVSVSSVSLCPLCLSVLCV